MGNRPQRVPPNTLPSLKTLVSGNVDEMLILAFAQDQFVGVDVDVRTMQPADCRESFVVTATGATWVSSDTFLAEVDLAAGEFHDVVIPFSFFNVMNWSHLIMRISEFSSSGPSELLLSSSLVTAGSGETPDTGTVKWFNASKGFGFIELSEKSVD